MSNKKEFVSLPNVTLNVFVVILILTVTLTANVTASDNNTVYLRAISFDSSQGEPCLSSNRSISEYPVDVEGNYIVQFIGPVKPEWKEHLITLGCEIYDYIPDNAFIIRMDADTKETVQDLDFVHWIGIYQPASKISPELPIGEEANINLTVLLFRPEDREEISSILEDLGGEKLQSSGDVIKLEVNASLIEDIAEINGVEWIEEYIQPQLLNDVSRWVIQSYVNGSTPIWHHNITGTGQIVGISDSGLDYDSCFFWDSVNGAPPEDSGLPSSVTPDYNQRKVIVYHDVAGFGDYDDYPGHGTHTSGSIAGDNLATIGGYDTNDGMAYNAKLVFQDLGQDGSRSIYPPPDLTDLFLQAYDDNARIHSNSWGSSAFGKYTTESKQCDEFMWNHKQFLILFANGNDGPYSNSVGSPATAKNVVSVGATENGAMAENMAYFSSHGPTDDGRIKPTVCAPGVDIWSAESDGNIASYNCGVNLMSGTSMSAPITAGAAALIRQYFVDGYYPAGNASSGNSITPSAALIKAVLVNSGEEMSGSHTDGPIPSNGQGWGRILLDNALYFDDDSRRLEIYDSDSVNTGESKTYNIAVDNQSEPLEVTLVWTDYPSTPAAAINLVNDLNLVVSGPDGIYTNSDNRNVVESVYIQTPSVGAYTVTVTGYNVPEGPQPFALVITGGLGIGSKGGVYLDKGWYNCSSIVNVTVKDADLNTDNGTVEEVNVSIVSFPTETTPEDIRLTETGVDTATFSGSIRLTISPAAPDGDLSVAHGDLITVYYMDADDGTGNPATVYDTATVDCIPPIITVATPQNNTTYNSNAVALNYSVNEKTEWESYSLDGQPIVIISGNTTLTNLTDGWHDVTVFASDIAGNIGASNKIWFNITTADIWVYPEAFEVILPQGNITNRTLTIGNNGSGVLEFEISDVEGTIVYQMEVGSMECNPETANINTDLGITTTKTYNYKGAIDSLSILLYTDDYVLPLGFTYPELALQELGYSYTATNDPVYFNSLLLSETWDMAIVDHNNFYTIGNYWPNIENFVNSGGLCIVTTFDVDGSHSVPTTLWNTLGATWASNIFMPENVYKWDLSHPVFTTPENVPDFTYWEESYGDDGDKTDPLVSAIAGFTTSSSSDQAAIIVGNEGRTILNSFLICEDRGDMDSDGVLDAIELWKNEITYVLVGGADWLTENPQNGSVNIGDQTNITVTFNATDLDLGRYDATIVIDSNDPDENPVGVPVHLIVTQLHPPDIWVEPQSFNITAFVDEVNFKNLTIGNNGTGDLAFNISVMQHRVMAALSDTNTSTEVIDFLLLSNNTNDQNLTFSNEEIIDDMNITGTPSLLWNYYTGYRVYSSPAISDIDGDGKPEVVIGSDSNYVYALNGEDGSILWSYYATYDVSSSPAIADIDGDGKLEVVFGTEDGYVYALNGENGAVLWSYYTGYGVYYSSPAIGDIDDDGKNEIVLGCDYYMYALNGEDGSILWSHYAGDGIASSPAIADIDGDGKLEVVFGSYDGYVRALNGEDGSKLWSYYTGSSVTSSPALGDIDGDGKLEIIVGSANSYVYTLNGEDGSMAWSHYTGDYIYRTSPALGDIDGDGNLEIVIGSGYYVYALNHDGTKAWSYYTSYNVYSSPAIGDIDGDGKNEVVIGSDSNYLYALNGEDGTEEWSYYTNGDISSSPAIEDVDNDGNTDIVVGSEDSYVYALDCSEAYNPSNIEWGTFHHDNMRTGLYAPIIKWINITPTTGLVSPKNQTNLSIELNTTSLDAGAYNATIIITHNDILQDTINVPVTLNVFNAPHEIEVTKITAPGYAEINSTIVVNSTISNFGSNDESDITIDFIVDGINQSSATLSYLASFASANVSFTWTAPGTPGIHNLTIYAEPVPGENITENNRLSKNISVITIPDIWIYPEEFILTLEKDEVANRTLTIGNNGTGALEFEISGVSTSTGSVLVDEGHGNTPHKAYYNDLVSQGFIVDYTMSEITPSLLSGYDAFITVQARYSYSVDEIAAIKNFVNSGGGLFVIGDDYPYLYDRLTGYAGISWSSYSGSGGTTTYIYPHDITNGVNVLYFAGPAASLIVSGPAQEVVRDSTGLTIQVAASEYGSGKIVGLVDEDCLGDYSINMSDNRLFGRNVINWLCAGASWLNVTPQNGTVSLGNQTNVTVTFNATDLDRGTYNATIVINSTDPDENIVDIPVHLQVITLPHIISASPSDPTPTQYVNITNTFSVSTDQVMTSNDWYILPDGISTLGNGTSSLTVTWAHVGVYNVTYIGTNENGSVNITWTVTAIPLSTETCNISLTAGWNMISVPLNPIRWVLGEEAVVGNPLDVTPTNSFVSIYRYDTSSGLFEKCDHLDDWGWWPATGSESFTELEPCRGYWVWAKSDCELTFTGIDAFDIDVTLDTDWNLIGWYSIEEALLGEEAVVGNPLNVTPLNSLTSVYRFNSSTKQFEKCDHLDDWGWWPATGSESFTALEPGRGYWVWAENGCVWQHKV